MNKKLIKKVKVISNIEIRSSQVRLVGDNVNVGVYPISEALKIAENLNLDLIEISSGDIPVCKIIKLDKYLYELKKKDKEQKCKQRESEIKTKEIRLGSNIDDHDFNFKLKHAIDFLISGDSVLVTIIFKGREISHPEIGENVLIDFTEQLKEYGIVDDKIHLEGKRMFVKIRSKHRKIQNK